MDEKLIKEAMAILTDWNPLGSRAKTILDLNDYRTEAIDILFNLNMRKENPTLIVKQVLDQAFDLALSFEECRAAGDKFTELLRKQ